MNKNGEKVKKALSSIVLNELNAYTGDSLEYSHTDNGRAVWQLYIEVDVDSATGEIWLREHMPSVKFPIKLHKICDKANFDGRYIRRENYWKHDIPWEEMDDNGNIIDELTD